MIEFKETPACAESPSAYRQWMAINRLTPKQPAIYGFCSDCTPEYQARMIAEGRCKYPEILFDQNGEGILFKLPFAQFGEEFLTDDEVRKLTHRTKLESIGLMLEKMGIPYAVDAACKFWVIRDYAAKAYRKYRLDTMIADAAPKVTPPGVIRHRMKC